MLSINNVSLPGKPTDSTWNVNIVKDTIISIESGHHEQPLSESIDGAGGILVPSLCHPHVHLDKAFLLSHPDYPDYKINEGTFEEALNMTNDAKAQFTVQDLQERGERLIDESIEAGVTHMRAFVELDNIVQHKCLDAGLRLKRNYEKAGRCKVQLCAYAQLPLFQTAANDEGGQVIRKLMQDAAGLDDVDVIGSTPYVEKDKPLMEQNIDWMIDLSIAHNKHLDFHLDYDIDESTVPTVWHVIETLKKKQWVVKTSNRTIVFGHCTRLTLWSEDEWKRLAHEIGHLPVSFCGLPTSDLYMLTREGTSAMAAQPRCSLDVVKIVEEYSVNACLGINNIGNAFTPQGSCDPMLLACNGVGLYSAGTVAQAELLFECISSRARQAIGYEKQSDRISSTRSEVKAQDQANLMLFPSNSKHPWRTWKTISEAVYLYNGAQGRRSILEGKIVDVI